TVARTQRPPAATAAFSNAASSCTDWGYSEAPIETTTGTCMERCRTSASNSASPTATTGRTPPDPAGASASDLRGGRTRPDRSTAPDIAADIEADGGLEPGLVTVASLPRAPDQARTPAPSFSTSFPSPPREPPPERSLTAGAFSDSSASSP